MYKDRRKLQEEERPIFQDLIPLFIFCKKDFFLYYRDMKEIVLLGILSTLFLGIVLLTLWVFMLQRKLKKLLRGKSAQSLEEVIAENNADIKNLSKNSESQEARIAELEEKIKKSIQHISLLRFDALNEKSGKQSFAIGLTNEYKTGIVISSLYNRDRMNVFAKEVTEGTSKHTLTKEEQHVIR